MSEESLFHEALSKPPADRAAFLDAACAGQPELRAAVEALLAAHEASGNPLDQPAATGLCVPQAEDEPVPAQPLPKTTNFQPTTGPGAVIAGRYMLMDKIGEGGMGEVWVARQIEPVKRKVALKLIKAGMDSRAVLARFEQERQALALMDHPNIAKVLDGGVTPDGHPFFVMELVNGLPLTKFCDEAKLTPKDRLQLFVPICQAVQHAHQKGIVHRDLKPANILVTLIDGKPVPKVIDFGVAKATAGKITDESMNTHLGAVVGTLEYMSPEQAGYSGDDIDTRADIYSLGVILYELLTGLRPIDSRRLKQAALAEMIRIIQEVEPSKPSTRLSTDQGLPSLAALRQTEPKRLMAMLRGELDWVVMKCLEKQRDRRYETANGLARDIQRYLADEPVEARPPTARYRLRKFLRRHKGPVAAGAALAALLLLGTVGTSVGLLWALAAEKLATDRLDEVTKEKERATKAETQAKEEAATAQAVVDFLRDDLLAEAAPEKNARNKQVTVEELLGKAADRVADKFGQQPQIEAMIRLTIGTTYRSLGNYAAAQSHLERTLAIARRLLGEDDVGTLRVMHELGSVLKDRGQFAQAELLLGKVVEGRRRLLGENDPATLMSINNLAGVYQSLGEYAKAEALDLQVLASRRRVFGQEHPDTLLAMANLAALYQHQKQYDKSEALLVQAVEVSRRVLGDEHEITLTSMNNLAALYWGRDEFAKAMPLFKQLVAINRRIYGEEHRRTLIASYNLAAQYHGLSDFGQAEPLFLKVLELRRRTLGEEHPDTLNSLHSLGNLYRDRGQFAQAEQYYVRVVQLRRQVLGNEHPDTLNSTENLGVLYWSIGKFAQAVPLFEKQLNVQKVTLGLDHPDTLTTQTNLAVNLRDAGHPAEALALLEDAVARVKRQPEPVPANVAAIPSVLAETYDQVGQFAKAEPLYRDFLNQARRQFGSTDPGAASPMATLGLNLLRQKKYVDAEPVLRECLVIRDKTQPDAWQTFNTQSMLGAALVGQKKYAEAEPLLLQGCEGMKQRAKTMPAQAKRRLTEALERLVQLYDTMDKKEEAAKWRKELEAAQPAQPKQEIKP